MVGFNIFAPFAYTSDSAPKNVVIRQNQSDEPSALGSANSSFLEPIIEGDEENTSKESSKDKKRSQDKTTPAMDTSGSGGSRGSLISRDTDDGIDERDYDRNPTQLYTLLQGRSWEDAITRVEKYPHEVKIWIYRKELEGEGVRWRLLPLHASVIFKAPVEVVESILTVYSGASRERDDQGFLPIHLAYKRGASASTYRTLLESFPACLDEKDSKGRTPRDMARHGSGPRHVEFVYALKVHSAARKLAREEARAEEEKIFKAKLEEEQKEHTEKLQEVKEANRIEIAKMEKKIKSLEEDVEVSKSVSESLNTNIEELKSRLKQHHEAESSLARQLAEKSAEVEEGRRKASPEEEQMEEELKGLASQIADLKQQVSKLLLEKEILNKSLESVVESTEWEKRKLEKKIEEQRRTIEALKQAARKSEVEKAKLRQELQKKEDRERDLSDTIENLETQLKCRNDSADEAVEGRKQQVESLEAERDVLKDSNNRMSTQLKSVAVFLGDMKEEQVALVDQAAVHEREMDVVANEHTKILGELEEQRKRDAEAQQSRKLIAAILRAQEEEMARNTDARKKIEEAIAMQSGRMDTATAHRQDLVASAESIGRQVEDNLNSILGTRPCTSHPITSDADSLLDVTAASHASFYWSQASTACEPSIETERLSSNLEQ